MPRFNWPSFFHEPKIVAVDRPLPLAVAIITLDEEENLPRCLESIRGLASEIVVIDSGSTDRTREVAASFGARVEINPWPGFVAQQRRALDRALQPWVLFLDADEAPTPELVLAIREKFAPGEPRESGFWVNRRTFYLGKWIWHGWYPEWRLRLVRKTDAVWGGLDPHPKLEVSGATARLKGDLLHYSFRDLQDHLQRSLRYAKIMAESYAAQGRSFHWAQFIFSPWVAFFKHLLWKQGWRDGWRGWLIALVKFVDVFAKYAFLLELEKTQPARR